MTKLISKTLAYAVLVFCFISCGPPTLPCGTFRYSGRAITENLGPGYPPEIVEPGQVIFNFNPSVCSSTCNCNTICYVLIDRTIDRTTGDFLASSSNQQNRIVTNSSQATINGWAVERVPWGDWGYFARNNDGSFNGNNVTTGSNASPAYLELGGRWEPNTWNDFVCVPVCIDNNAPCVNSLLGYYYWLITGEADPPFNEIGVDWNKDAFDAAVTEWNIDAPGLGKHPFPVFTRMAQ